jgi:hypothetical protein
MNILFLNYASEYKYINYFNKYNYFHKILQIANNIGKFNFKV